MDGFIKIYATNNENYYINISQIKYIHQPKHPKTEYEKELGKNYVQIYLDNDKILMVDSTIEEINELIRGSKSKD